MKKQTKATKYLQESLFQKNDLEFCKRNELEIRLTELRFLDNSLDNEQASLHLNLAQYHDQVGSLSEHEKNLHWRFAEMNRQLVGLNNTNHNLKEQLERQGAPPKVDLVEMSSQKSKVVFQSIREKIEGALSIQHSP